MGRWLTAFAVTLVMAILGYYGVQATTFAARGSHRFLDLQIDSQSGGGKEGDEVVN